MYNYYPPYYYPPFYPMPEIDFHPYDPYFAPQHPPTLTKKIAVDQDPVLKME